MVSEEVKLKNGRCSEAIRILNATKILADNPRVLDLIEDAKEILIAIRDE